MRVLRLMPFFFSATLFSAILFSAVAGTLLLGAAPGVAAQQASPVTVKAAVSIQMAPDPDGGVPPAPCKRPIDILPGQPMPPADQLCPSGASPAPAPPPSSPPACKQPMDLLPGEAPPPADQMCRPGEKPAECADGSLFGKGTAGATGPGGCTPKAEANCSLDRSTFVACKPGQKPNCELGGAICVEHKPGEKCNLDPAKGKVTMGDGLCPTDYIPCSANSTSKYCEEKDCPDGSGLNYAKRFFIWWVCNVQTWTADVMRWAIARWATDPSSKPSECRPEPATGEVVCKIRPETNYVRLAVYPLAVVIVTASVIWQGIMMIITRRSEPVVDLLRGFFVLILWLGIGVEGPRVAMELADYVSIYFVKLADKQGVPTDWAMEVAMVKAFSVENYLGILAACLFVMLAAGIQYLIMLFREGTVLILAGAMVLAASGAFTQSTRNWLPKLIGQMLALIAYKPTAALVMLAASKMYETSGKSMDDWWMALMMLWMSIFALPVLMKMFSWTTGSVGGSGMQAANNAATTYALYGRNNK